MPEKPPSPDQILRGKHAQFHPSEENRPMRSGMDDKSIGEMAQSILENGIIVPLLVRTHKESGQFEIVAGERRWTAYGVAMEKFGVKDGQIPYTFRELTDAQVRKMRLIENVQREDIHPLEEAGSYRELLDMVDEAKRPVVTIQDLVKSVGKSQAWIYARLKLLEMPDLAKDACITGKLNASVALLISRIPDPKQAHKATLEVLTPYGNNTDEKAALDPEIEPMSFRKAKDHISNNYMIRLKDTPFDQKDENLVPIYYDESVTPHRRIGGGSCEHCPFRTGNMKEQGADNNSTDVCTNTVCFKKKKDTSWRAEKSAAKEKGQELLTENQSRKLLNHDGTGLADHARSEFVDIREKIPGRKVTWEDALEDHLPENTVVTLARGKKNVLLLPVDVVAEAAKSAKIKFEKPEPQSRGGYDPEAQKKEEEARIERQKKSHAIIEVAWNQVKEKLAKQKNHLDLLSLFARELCPDNYLEANNLTTEKAVSKHLAALKEHELWTIIVFSRWFTRPVSYQGAINEEAAALCKFFDLDLKAIEKSLQPKDDKK